MLEKAKCAENFNRQMNYIENAAHKLCSAVIATLVE